LFSSISFYSGVACTSYEKTDGLDFGQHQKTKKGPCTSLVCGLGYFWTGLGFGVRWVNFLSGLGLGLSIGECLGFCHSGAIGIDNSGIYCAGHMEDSSLGYRDTTGSNLAHRWDSAWFLHYIIGGSPKDAATLTNTKKRNSMVELSIFSLNTRSSPIALTCLDQTQDLCL
jgi:hypothetical protein